MNTAKLMEHFNEIDGRNRGELGFDDFSRLYLKLLMNSMVDLAMQEANEMSKKFCIFQTIKDCVDGQFSYTRDHQTVHLQGFQSFLLNEQIDLTARDEKVVSHFIRDFVQDPQRDIAEPFLTISEVSFIIYVNCARNIV